MVGGIVPRSDPNRRARGRQSQDPGPIQHAVDEFAASNRLSPLAGERSKREHDAGTETTLDRSPAIGRIYRFSLASGYAVPTE
jgi:hypothetical protein